MLAIPKLLTAVRLVFTAVVLPFALPVIVILGGRLICCLPFVFTNGSIIFFAAVSLLKFML